MKKVYTLLCSIMLVSCLCFANIQPVLANDINRDMESGIEERILQELNVFTAEQKIPVSLKAVNCKIDYSYFRNQDELDRFVDEKIILLKESLGNIHLSYEEKSNKLRGIEDRGSYYTAKVESIVPAIGWGYICQDFTASVSSGKINSISLSGNAYDTGITLGSFEPNRSWYDISTNKNYCQIHMKGTVNYLWKGLNLSLDATFLATGKANGSKIETTYDDWPG